MSEALIGLAIFVPLGLSSWWLSHHFGIPGYSTQPIRKTDIMFVPVAFAVSALILGWIGPMMISGANSLVPWLQDFHRQFGLIFNLLGSVILTDFVGYWIHRMMHTQLMWRYHALHHSPVSLNWISGLLGSPVDFLFLLLGMTFSKIFFDPGESLPVMLFLGTINVISQHTSHSNIRLPWPDLLELIFVSPRLHFVHHNPKEKFTNSNYGFYFTIWDRVFNTYQSPHSPDLKYELGLNYQKRFFDLFIGR